MRYILPGMGLLGFLWFTIGSLLEGRGLRRWQRRAAVLLGLSGMSFCAVLICLWYSRTQAFYTEKGSSAGMMVRALGGMTSGLLAGITIGLFVALWLEGTCNVLRKKGKKGTA